MGWALTTLLILPAASAIVCLFAPRWLSRSLTLSSAGTSFALALWLVGRSGRVVTALGGWLRADALSVVFLVTVAFLYAGTAVFSIGYGTGSRPSAPRGSRQERLYASGLNAFCWSMLVAPLMANMALLWVGVEVTTVISALLVAVDGTGPAREAAWKYLLIASMGLSIALLATIVLYSAADQALGSGFAFTYDTLVRSAPMLPRTLVRLAFVLAVVGYGTKMGLVPMHTWLPDAHSEAPSSVSALLSGALLAVAFYGVLRFFEIALGSLGGGFPRNVMLGFGFASLVLSALFLARQRDLKRLLAYSSVEHMGIVSVGMSFAAPLAIAGVLLHVLAHAAGKGTAFFGAGSILAKLGQKDIARLGGIVRILPLSGPLLVGAILGLCAMPPGGLFRSELMIVAGGLSDPSDVVVAIMLTLVTIASFGLTYLSGRALLGTALRSNLAMRGEASPWIVASMVFGIAGLVLLGLHPPSSLVGLLQNAAHELGRPR